MDKLLQRGVLLFSACLLGQPVLAQASKTTSAVKPTTSAPTSTWTLLKPAGLGFSVKLPANAKYQEQTDLAQSKHRIWIAVDGDCMYQVAIGQFNALAEGLAATKTDSGRQSTLGGLCNGFFDSMERSSGGVMKSKQMDHSYTINGFPARDYTFALLHKDGKTVLSGKSIFCVTEHCTYTFTSAGKSKPSPAFLASIQFLK